MISPIGRTASASRSPQGCFMRIAAKCLWLLCWLSFARRAIALYRLN
jgi:hypothetical protein